MRRLLAICCTTVVLLLSLLVGNPAFSADIQKGWDAWWKKDYTTALKVFRSLANQGNATAQFKLGSMYARGEGVPQNYTTTVKWYTLAAKQGHEAAQFNLGWMYENGQGVTRNDKTAVKWYRLSAGQGVQGSGFSQMRLEYLQKKIARLDKEKKQKPKPKAPAAAKSSIDKDKVLSVASGTGFAVSSLGHVVTNSHVIAGCKEVKIHHKGKSIAATIIANDPINDLALLKGAFRPTSIFSLSRKNPKLMQEIFVAGYPFGKNISSSVKVTRGIVSSLTGLGNNISNMQIDAAVQPGNSGGPIFNDKGNVVGVAVAKLDLKKVLEAFGTIPENTNFGIKSNVVVNLLESNSINPRAENKRKISSTKLGDLISDATYYLSCWMTMAQIEHLKAKKVFFSDLAQ